MNYERIVQWSAGPISILAGTAATALSKLHIFTTLGYTQKGISGAIVTVGTFTVGAGVTYAAHHKWLDNLSKWWTVVPRPGVLTVTPVGNPASIPPATMASGTTPVGHPVGFIQTETSVMTRTALQIQNEVLRQQLKDAGLPPVA